MKRFFLIVAVCVAAGCVGVPQPQPVPGLVRRSTALSQNETLVVGLPGAVPDGARVLIQKQGDRESEVTSEASSKGSFATVIAVGSEATIEIRYAVGSEETSEPLVLKENDIGPLGPYLETADAIDAVSAPDAKGMVTVSNDGPDPPFLASPDSEATISNGRTGEVVATTTDAEGVLTVKIAARTGDVIYIMLADPEIPSTTSDFLTFTVPP